MALVKELSELCMERNNVHQEVSCTYSIFRDVNGQQYLQIDTYGSSTRQEKGKKSQSIQFDKESIAQLMKIIKTVSD